MWSSADSWNLSQYGKVTFFGKKRILLILFSWLLWETVSRSVPGDNLRNMNITIDKVANTPPLAIAEGWPARNKPNSDNHEIVLNEAKGDIEIGADIIVSEEQPVRHHVPDPSSSLPSVRLTESPGHPIDTKLSPRLQPVLQNDAQTSANDSDDPEQTLESKAASFYIGDETLSPPPHEKTQTASGIPWKVSVAGTEVVEFTPPDGGYGWVVALAACFINLWIIGFTKSYGVLYVSIRETYPEASAYHISWVPSLLSTVGLLTGQLFRCKHEGYIQCYYMNLFPTTSWKGLASRSIPELQCL